jgi:hypothetical protein
MFTVLSSDAFHVNCISGQPQKSEGKKVKPTDYRELQPQLTIWGG